MKEFHNIINGICEELGIKLTFLSDEWAIVLEKDDQIHYVVGYKFGLNDHAIGIIVDDKGLFFDLLTSKSIPCIYQKVIFSDYNKNEVLDFFNSNNREIVVKGNLGTCGKEVFKVSSEDDLFDTINELFKSQYSISICPFYHVINEYRVILVNKKARVVYGKEKAKVVGNGKSTVMELANEINAIKIDKDVPLDYIPKLNEEIPLTFQFNLSQGAKMFMEIDESLKQTLISMAENVVNTLNIPFASVDIIKTYDNKLLVMEANSGVMMDSFIEQNPDGYNIAYSIYRDAIKSMFNIK